MKNKILKIILLIILALAIGTVISNAAVVVNNPTVQTGENVTINVTSQELIDGYKISISSNSGLTFLSATGGTYAQGQIVSGVNPSGMKSLATYNFKAPEVSKDTTYKVTFLVEGIIPHGTEEKTSSTIQSTITVKAKETPKPPEGGNTGGNNPSGNTGNNSGTTNKPTVTEPKFTSASKTVYATGDINLRSSWSTSSTATKVAKGTELRLTGISTEKVNGYVWYRVTYNGQIKYVVNNLITETKPEEEKSNNTNLKTLSIENVELAPVFSSDVLQYTATLNGYEQKEIKVIAEAEDVKSTVKVEGNTNIIVGENIITIEVKAEDGTTKTYKIILTNEKETLLGLQTLKIKDVDLKNFSSDKFEYEIRFKDLEKLEIEAIANVEGATVEILGNENLKDGENIITIIVTSADEQETVTYQIRANKLEKVEQEENKQLNIKSLLICGVIALVVLVIIIVLIVKYVKNGENSNIDYVYNDNLESKENDSKEIDKEVQNEKIEEDLQEKKDESVEENIAKEQEEKAKVDDLFTNYDDESPKKRGRGKHSR